MRNWIADKNKWKGFLTGLATGGSVTFSLGFFKSEHFLIQALLAAYFSFVIASFIQYFMKEPRISE